MKTNLLISAFITTAIALITSTSANGASISPVTGAQQLVDKLLGTNSGITVVGTPTLTGNLTQFGIFQDGNAGTGLGIEAGIMLSTGRADNAIGSYSLNADGNGFAAPGDAQLTTIAGKPTFDAASLEFNFTTTTGNLYFLDYVFASQEYPQYVRSSFNDAFAYFINGQNIARVPGTNSPVSVNTINNGRNDTGNQAANPQYYISNASNARTLEFGGLTVPLSAAATGLDPNVVHTFKIAIADAQDDRLNSAVFLSSNGISATPIYGGSTAVPEPSGIIGVCLSALSVLAARRRLRKSK